MSAGLMEVRCVFGRRVDRTPLAICELLRPAAFAAAGPGRGKPGAGDLMIERRARRAPL
jgi:hypothetical protein